MSEERKDINAQLTDEAVEQATGGYNPQPEPRTVSCPECRFTYTFMAQRIAEIPPDCPNCGYKWVLTVQRTAL